MPKLIVLCSVYCSVVAWIARHIAIQGKVRNRKHETRDWHTPPSKALNRVLTYSPSIQVNRLIPCPDFMHIPVPCLLPDNVQSLIDYLSRGPNVFIIIDRQRR